MKYIFLTLATLFIFGGCSAKEFNEGFDSISNDVSKTFEDGRDKSAN